MIHPVDIPAADACLVGFSGGADSRLLLELCAEAAAKNGMRLCAAHLHHGIRGAEADRDEAFCRQVCADRGIPLFVEHADIPALSRESGQSLELCAREARYRFFRTILQGEQIPLLLTAHHADDVLETLLLRFLRGSGLRGMGGIPPVRELGYALPDGTPCRVARPLLSWTRADIQAELTARGLDFVTDSTNLCDDCTRNRLRHEIVPALEAIAGAGQPQRAAGRLARAAREDEEALDGLARSLYAAAMDMAPAGTPAGRTPKGRIRLELWIDQPPAIAKRVIGLAYADFVRESLRDSARDRSPADETESETCLPLDRTLSAAHLEMLLALCRDSREGAVSDLLPADVRGEIHDGCLTFSVIGCPGEPAAGSDADRPPDADDSPEKADIRLLDEGITPWDPLHLTLADLAARPPDAPPCLFVRIETLNAPAAPLSGGNVWASAVFPADAVPLPLAARTRQAGDTILSHGVRKKLKKLLTDQKIPVELRDRLPLFCCAAPAPGGSAGEMADELLWYPRAAFRDGYPAPVQGRALRVSVYLFGSLSFADDEPAAPAPIM